MDLVEARARGFAQRIRHPWEYARLAVVSAIIREQAPPGAGDLVLDVGCGDTFVVESLARAYPAARFVAVDSAFTPDVLRTLQQRLTVPNVTLAASTAELPATVPASLVLLMDVLEHVSDDRQMLRGLVDGALVDQRTRVLVTVPAFGWLFSSHDRFLLHHRRYTRSTLDALLAAGGLVATESGYLFASLLPMRLAQVLRERVLGESEAPQGLAAWAGGARATRLLARALEWDGRVTRGLARLGVRLPGLSVYALCRTSA